MTSLTLDDLAARLKTNGRAGWRYLLLFALVGGAAGAGASLLMAPVFRSGASFQAESGTTSSLPGALAGLASQLGNLPLGNTVNAQFFADILTSDAVLRRVINDTLPWKGGRATLAEIYGYTGKPPAIQQDLVTQRLRRSISNTVNTRTNMVRFTIEAGAPDLAKALADAVLTSLNEVNVVLRQNRASAEQAFTAARAEEARRDLAEAEAQLTLFRSRNRIVGSPALQTEEGRLLRAVDMSQTIYTQLRLQQEQAAVQAVRNTPAISIVDPPIEPVKKVRPRRRMIAIMGLIGGLCLGATWLLLYGNPARTSA